jgi:hypothetical protein
MLAGMGLALAGSLNGCNKQAEPAVPSQPSVPSTEIGGLRPDCQELVGPVDPPEDCWADHDADVLLARLAVATFAVYGRLDPGLLVPSADGTTLNTRSDAKPIDPKSPWLELFVQTALDVAKNDLARRAYLAGSAAALIACGADRCPNLAQPHKVTLEKDVPDGAEVNYHFRISAGPIPSSFEWEQSVLRQFSYLPPHCDYFASALRIPDPEPIGADQDKAKTDAAPARRKSASSSKPTDNGAAYGEAVLGDAASARSGDCCRSSSQSSYRKKKKVDGDPPVTVCRGACPDRR